MVEALPRASLLREAGSSLAHPRVCGASVNRR
jgi:hypothetical protein